MAKPTTADYPVYFQKYIDLVPENDLITAFENQETIISASLKSISEEKSNFSYAAGKWTIKELLQHLTDSERIFCFRALCFARKDATPLPGFEEDDYALHSNANSRTWNDLVDEFLAVRKATYWLFKSFSADVLALNGTANNNKTSVHSIGFIILGHFYHHNNIIKERYL